MPGCAINFQVDLVLSFDLDKLIIVYWKCICVWYLFVPSLKGSSYVYLSFNLSDINVTNSCGFFSMYQGLEVWNTWVHILERITSGM